MTSRFAEILKCRVDVNFIEAKNATLSKSQFLTNKITFVRLFSLYARISRSKGLLYKNVAKSIRIKKEDFNS